MWKNLGTEEILNDKNVLMKQERDMNITNSRNKIATENLEERKFNKVRESERKEERKLREKTCIN